MANKVAEVLKVHFPVEVGKERTHEEICARLSYVELITIAILAKDSSMFQAFDGTLTLMEVAVSSLKDLINDKSHPQSSQVLGAMNTLLGMLIEYNVNVSYMALSLNEGMQPDAFLLTSNLSTR